jgi:predicted MFS family arabinose efflux permease
VIALIYAAPAALAGYSATSMLFGLASASEDWRQAFAIIGALAIGTVAWQRLAATLPPASDDNQRCRHRRGGRAHSTARWIRAADLSGGRCEFERHRLKRIMTER